MHGKRVGTRNTCRFSERKDVHVNSFALLGGSANNQSDCKKHVYKCSAFNLNLVHCWLGGQILSDL